MKPSQDTAARPSGRLVLLDEIRGLTLVSMILYHFIWDLVNIAGVPLTWYHGRGAYVWQQSICWTFIFLSGFCFPLGRRHLRRGLTVWLSGGLVTLVTLVFLPEDRVVFGVLTLLGSCMLLMIPLDKALSRVRRRDALIALAGAAFNTFICLHLYMPRRLPGIRSGLFLTWLGFPKTGFYSTDYFPMLPWFFLFLTGYLIHGICSRSGVFEGNFLRRTHFAPAAAIGRRSLPVYLLHQPVLYGITLLVMRLSGR